MTDFAMKRALRRTFDRTVCVYRPKSDGTEETVYIDIPCALSRSALVSAPAVSRERTLSETGYALTLYTMPEIWLRLSDRVVISEASGRSYHGRASDSVRYPSHCVSVIEITEVSLPVVQGGQPQNAADSTASDGGQDSQESCPSGGGGV